jgi:glutamate dehydrogenase
MPFAAARDDRRRLVEPVAVDSTPAAEVTVVGILNQDMPFLLDSTLGEIHAFGAGLRLVAHPIVSVADRKVARRVSMVRDRGRTGGP